jgi:hypothetical protein
MAFLSRPTTKNHSFSRRSLELRQGSSLACRPHSRKYGVQTAQLASGRPAVVRRAGDEQIGAAIAAWADQLASRQARARLAS